MTVTMPSVFHWQALRLALKFYKEKKNPTGRELRSRPTGKSKSGQFLKDLVAWGLLKATYEAEHPLDSHYIITAAGGRAADTGEWEGDERTWKAFPPAAPVAKKKT